MDAFQQMMERDLFAAGLGIELVDHGEGRAVTRMVVRPDMLNGYDVAHGGVIFTLADTAFACACNSVAPPSVAAAAEIVFVAPVHADDELFATAELRTPFGRSGIYDVTIRRGGRSSSEPSSRDPSSSVTVVAEFRGRSQQRRDG